MGERICCFAGHREDWHCLGLEQKLFEVIESLINEGVTTFFDGYHGAFDVLCAGVVRQLKLKYKHIKIIKVLSNYSIKKIKEDKPFYDEIILPPIEKTYYKAKVEKRNEWMVDNAEVLVCHIENNFNSGAYNIVKYAKKKNKKVIEI